MKEKSVKSKTGFGKSTGQTSGNKLNVGDSGPNFIGSTKDMTPFEFYKETKNKLKIISSVSSVDEGVSSLQSIRFNEAAATLKNDAYVITISADLPFAINRFCKTEGLEDSIFVSDYRNMNFGNSYGFTIDKTRLLSRGVVVLDRENTVIYMQYMKNQDMLPDYERALAAVEKVLYEETLEAVNELLHK